MKLVMSLGALLAVAAGILAALAFARSETLSQSLPRRGLAPQLARDNALNILSGDWGGQGVRLAISGDGTAVFDFDCAYGSAAGPLVVAGDGTFSWPGTFVREHGGPVRDGEPEDSYPAVFRGGLVDNELRLEVTLPESSGSGGSFVLKAGEVGRVTKCL